MKQTIAEWLQALGFIGIILTILLVIFVGALKFLSKYGIQSEQAIIAIVFLSPPILLFLGILLDENIGDDF